MSKDSPADGVFDSESSFSFSQAGSLARMSIERVLATSYQDAMLRILKGDPLLLPTIHRVAQLTLKALF